MLRNAVGLAALTVLCAVLPGAARAELVWLRAAPERVQAERLHTGER